MVIRSCRYPPTETQRTYARALRKTGSLQPALDWLQDHEDDDGEDSDAATGDDTDAGPSIPHPTGEAKVRRLMTPIQSKALSDLRSVPLPLLASKLPC